MEILLESDKNDSISYENAIYSLFGRFYRFTGMIWDRIGKDKIFTYDVIL